jgi:integrase
VTRRELPSDADIEIIKRSVDLLFGLFAYFILYSGLRRGELLALKWEDIDFDRNTISVNKAMYWNVNQPVIKDTKTEAGNRVVPLLQPLKDHLTGGEGYIFGLPTQTVFRRKWNKYRAETGIEVTPHQLRHAFATICYEAGIEDKDAQQLLGHASVSTTRDIYTHIREQRKQQTAEKLNAFVANDVVKSPAMIDNP